MEINETSLKDYIGTVAYVVRLSIIINTIVI